ncbi:MAG: metallophosphoesterase [Deltaproteobacteria bacterium]|nr:metallophosphoesterase [Deltaproteobacteria bacterium]
MRIVEGYAAGAVSTDEATFISANSNGAFYKAVIRVPSGFVRIPEYTEDTKVADPIEVDSTDRNTEMPDPTGIDEESVESNPSDPTDSEDEVEAERYCEQISFIGYESDDTDLIDDSAGVAVYAAGDIGRCGTENDTLTGNLLDSLEGPILVLGDAAQGDGSWSDFINCFDPPWGRHKERMYPTPGNHEYYVRDADAYFDYFGDAAGERGKGYYSFDIGDWHVVSLNTNCSEVMCSEGSEQEMWLRQDLAASDKACTLAFGHHPRYSSGKHGDTSAIKPLWQALIDHGAEIVLAGHDHAYQRYWPMDAEGNLSATGLTEFVVGTGGSSLRSFPNPQPCTCAIRQNTSFGVLRLTLKAKSFEWEFIPVEAGSFSDSGRAYCH